MKILIASFLLIINLTPLFSQTQKNNPVKYLPKDVSFVLYLNSMDKAFSDFKNTYFWKKYKLTGKGKELERTLNSIDASFLMLGLTLQDLLEVFSQQAILGVWADENNYIKNYVYLIEKKRNKNKIDSIIERFEYFAAANKIGLTKYKYNSFTIMNFTNQIYIANNDSFTLISDNRLVLNNICNNIKDNKIEEHHLMEFNNHLKNDNIVLYNNNIKSISGKNIEAYYSFEFPNQPEIEVLYKDKNNAYPDKVHYDNEAFKMLPSDINFVYIGQNDLRELIYPFFKLTGTNFYTLDQKYFDSFFHDFETEKENVYLTAGHVTLKETNILKIFNTANQSNIINVFPEESLHTTYQKTKIYKKDNGYYTILNRKVLYSKKLDFLKRAVSAYKSKRSFYYTSYFKKIRAYQSKGFILWMNLKKYLTDKALQYGKDRWAHYNAYIKTFEKILIYSNKKDQNYYLKLFFYQK
jgi:hypothetical protein